MSMVPTAINAKTLIALPIVLGLTIGLGFGAAWWSEKASTSTTATTTDEESTTEQAATETAAAAEGSEYVFFRDALEEVVAGEWSGTSTEYRTAAEANLSIFCQLIDNPSAINRFPAGPIREYWSLPSGSGGEFDRQICSSLPASDVPITLDRDNDGLPALAERWYGTSDDMMDTDGDGFPDAEEITNGYSPRERGSSQ